MGSQEKNDEIKIQENKNFLLYPNETQEIKNQEPAENKIDIEKPALENSSSFEKSIENKKTVIEISDLTEKDTQMDSVENSVSLRKLSNVENSDLHRSESITHELNNQNFTENNDAIQNKDTQILKDDKLDETNKFEIEKSDITEKDTQMDSVENSVSLRKSSNVENSDLHRSESKTRELNNQNFTENNDAKKNQDTQVLKDDKLDETNKFEIEKSDLTEKDTQMDSVKNSVSLRNLSNVL